MARKGAQKGTLTDEESNLVANALRLNNIQVHEIMTPRTVMLALDQDLTVEKVFACMPTPPSPASLVSREHRSYQWNHKKKRLAQRVVEETPDKLLKDLSQEAIFVPENASADKALRLLPEHCQLSIVVDEFGSVAGVLAMEDIIESIIGQEIFELDDMAVDMREFAKRKHKARIKQKPKSSD